MKTITVSSAVFAAIWKAHKDGDESEDTILRRLLNLPPGPSPVASESGAGRIGGFYDERSGTHFPEGRRIFRVYKGRKYEAIAERDRLFVPASGKSYHSLNKLSRSVHDGEENAWLNWKFKDEEGNEHLIDELRKDSRNKISSRRIE
ncbi:hypothetical protein [Bradyrhizobium sp. URHA0013]|uniref:hypothetical protein n=1 Tax=Bradyrhizobium sp. URHA0013 TaxID=1380352 RepID=UPI00048A373F|nr:hypothetical protein [Bradyrhizobium sp. URHA0013]